MASQMTPTNLVIALEHVRNVCADGRQITLKRPSLAGSDEFGGITTAEPLSLNAFPIRFSPFAKRVLQSISWSEEVDVIFYIAHKQVTNLSLDIYDIKDYISVIYNGATYELKYADMYSQFADSWLYVIIGARK